MLIKYDTFVSGEKLGMEYLYSQSGMVLVEKEDDLSSLIDEGIELDSDSVTDVEEGDQDPLNDIIFVESDETPQEETNVEVCLVQYYIPSNQILYIFPLYI
ncbi:hypothetical protein OS493_019379 [Desmophyllum pertusum]|uniref:Uncharacterized protein n=1 Tax=Desmophyllum pertusum TaxID=174260 RepID=A0A9X0A0J1_9CNID|nr:hypothetical protein OS493_019379 [Desmophyllum pertusum]